MFIRPYQLKSNAPLKGSDAKKLRQRLQREFSSATPEQLQSLLPPKGNVTVLKIVTHKEFQTNVYCVDKLPLFFEVEGGRLVPTLYAMWRTPELLPYFTTVPAVLPKLSNGADLMLPGVIPQGTGMNIYGRYKKDQLVAVNLTSNKAAIGVGALTRSSDDLYMCGGHGSAVSMFHTFGDKLWGHEPSLSQQLPNIKPAELTGEDFPELGKEPKKSAKKDAAPTTFASILAQQQNPPKVEDEEEDDGWCKLGGDSSPLPEIGAMVVNAGESEDSSSSDAEEDTATVTPEDQLKCAFLSALKNHGKTLQLPLLTSNFFRLYVVPEASEQLDLKKTKYKKLSNFLAEMIDQGFIIVREEAKGVDKITSIDFEHPELVNFITDVKPPSGQTDEKSEEQPLFHSELMEVYVVTDATAAFFTKLDFKRGEGIPVGQIKKIVRQYISKQGLAMADPATRTVFLDEVLKQICGCDAAPLGKICIELTNRMDHTYQMCAAKDVSANKPLIQMSLATRSGNKKVTLISNIECYGIILPEFIKLCKQGAAASTSIVKLPHQKREQLQIQGNQVRFIHTLLTQTYKVPPKCILGLELAKDAKKNKKKK